MKKWTLVLAMMIALSACSQNNNESVRQPEAADGVSAFALNGRLNYYPDELPFSVDYDGGTVALNEVKCYEVVDENDAHTMFVKIEMGMTGFNDEQAKNIKNNHLSIYAYIKSEENDFKLEPLHHLGDLSITDEGKLLSVYMTSVSDLYRKGFAGAEVSVSIELEHEDMFIPNLAGVSEDPCESENISWSESITDALPSAENIEEPLYGYVAKWLLKENIRLFQMSNAK